LLHEAVGVARHALGLLVRFEERPLHLALARGDERGLRIGHTYVSRGLYAVQLERWLAAFTRDRLLVLTNDELSERPAETYARTLRFLGVRAFELDTFPRVFEGSYPPLDAVTHETLRTKFAEPNRRLAELLGRDLAW
jgi:hypothetical protein